MAKCSIPHCVGRFNEATGNCEFHPASEIKRYFKQQMRGAMAEERRMSKKHSLGPSRCPNCGRHLDEVGDCSNQGCVLLELNAATA